MSKKTEEKKERREIPPYHTFDESKTLKELATDINVGLSSSEANERLEKYGLNELEKEEPESIWEKIKEQFEDLLVRLLLLAAVISFVVSQFGKFFRAYWSLSDLNRGGQGAFCALLG